MNRWKISNKILDSLLKNYKINRQKRINVYLFIGFCVVPSIKGCFFIFGFQKSSQQQQHTLNTYQQIQFY